MQTYEIIYTTQAFFTILTWFNERPSPIRIIRIEVLNEEPLAFLLA